MSARNPSPEEAAQVTALFNDGRTDAAIMEATGYGKRKVEMIRTALGLKHRRGHPANLVAKVAIDREFVHREFRERMRPAADLVQVLRNIAELTGKNPDSIRRVLREDGLLVGRDRTKPPYTPEQLTRADDMLDGTIPYTEVAQTVGMTVDTLVHALPRRGLRPENKGTYRVAKQMAKALL